MHRCLHDNLNAYEVRDKNKAAENKKVNMKQATYN